MEEYKAKMQSSILTFGILGIIFGWLGGILVIIFSAVGLSKSKKYVAEGNELTGKAKVGKILATVGLILGIIGLIVGIIYIVMFAVAAGNAVQAYMQ